MESQNWNRKSLVRIQRILYSGRDSQFTHHRYNDGALACSFSQWNRIEERVEPLTAEEIEARNMSILAEIVLDEAVQAENDCLMFD